MASPSNLSVGGFHHVGGAGAMVDCDDSDGLPAMAWSHFCREASERGSCSRVDCECAYMDICGGRRRADRCTQFPARTGMAIRMAGPRESHGSSHSAIATIWWTSDSAGFVEMATTGELADPDFRTDAADMVSLQRIDSLHRRRDVLRVRGSLDRFIFVMAGLSVAWIEPAHHRRASLDGGDVEFVRLPAGSFHFAKAPE